MTEASRKERTNVAELTVSELSASIKRTLEGTFGHVRIRGEISGYRGPHSSGHCYFSLKDEKSRIEAVIWRGTFGGLRFKPEEGLEVIATGRVSSFPGSSKYQIVIEALEPAGIGALMALLEERRRKLGGEGLFDEGRKRKIPFLPRVVGIVTSPTGAVIRDMLHGFDERFPAHVLVWPVRVQGDTSAREVAAAIAGFNALPEHGGRIPRPDVLIVARGGGSLEDLWGFNEEIVVRAAAASRIPLISAVGHETDWTLLDLVADARAPTPTKAAEWAVPKYSDLLDQQAKLADRLRVAVRRTLEGRRTELRSAARGLPKPQDLTALPRQRFDAFERRLGRALLANTAAHGKRLARVAPRLQPRLLAITLQRGSDRLARTEGRGREALARLASQRRTRLERISGRLGPQLFKTRLARAGERAETLTRRLVQSLIRRVEQRRKALDGQSALLVSLSYQRVLQRGFALVRDGDGKTVRTADAARAAGLIDIEFGDGHAAATVAGPPDPPPQSPPSATGDGANPDAAPRDTTKVRSPRRTPTSGQGSLF